MTEQHPEQPEFVRWFEEQQHPEQAQYVQWFEEQQQQQRGQQQMDTEQWEAQKHFAQKPPGPGHQAPEGRQRQQGQDP